MSMTTKRTDGRTTRPTYSAEAMITDSATVRAACDKSGFNINSSGQPEIWDTAGNVQVIVGTSGVTTRGPVAGLPRTGGGLVSSAAGVAVHDSSTEAVSASLTIPASLINAGTVIKIRGRVRATATISTDTLQFRLRFGTTTLTGTSLITGTATDVADNDTMWFEFTIFGTAAAGATAACVGYGIYVEPAGTTVKSAKLDTTNFATNGALLLEATLKWSTTNANSALVEWMAVEIVG